MALWVPPAVDARLREESARRQAEALKALADDHRWTWKREFDAQLNRVVDGMRLAFCPDPAPLDAAGQGARPGCWHLVWPGFAGGPLVVQALAVDSTTGRPSLGGDGAPVEPGSWVFDVLAQADMWNERAMRDRRRIREEAEIAKRRRRELEIAEFDLDCLEHWKAANRTQVSMNRGVNGDMPWGQNAAGFRRIRGERARAARAAKT